MISKAGLHAYLYADKKHRKSNFNDLLLQSYKDGNLPFADAFINTAGEVIGTYNVTLVFSIQRMVNMCGEIWNNMPEFAHDQFVAELEECDNLGDVLIGTVTANGFSSKARNRIHPRGFMDLAVSPMASRSTLGNAFIAGVKKGMYCGLFPCDLPVSVMDNYRKVFSEQTLRGLPNGFSALFANTNLWVHPGPLLLGLVAAEMNAPGLKFYPDCFGGRFGSRVAANLAKAINALAQKYQAPNLPVGVDLSQFYYDFHASDIPDFAKRLPAYNAQSFMPNVETMEKSRYLIEDPAVLGTLATLAKLADMSPRPFYAVVDMVGMAINDDYINDTCELPEDDLSALDMKGLSFSEIIGAINETKDEWDQRWEGGLEAERINRVKAASGPNFHEFIAARLADPAMKPVWDEFVHSQF